jgi:hypothetical protein
MPLRNARRAFLRRILASGGAAAIASSPTGAVARDREVGAGTPALPPLQDGGRTSVHNGLPAIAVEEAVLFPFDEYSVPFTKSLLLSLVTGSKSPTHYMEGAGYDPAHPGRIVLRPGAAGEPDSVEVIGPTVIRVGNEYRMWYTCRGDSDPDSTVIGGKKMDRKRRIGYAVSTDGIEWRKPRLGIVEYRGTRDNNLVDVPSSAMVAFMHEPEDPAPDRRFKAVYQISPFRLAVAYSADGLRWKPSPNNPVGGGIELLYPPVKFNGCYYVNGQGGPTVLNKPVPHPVPGVSKRDLITYASYDFENWTRAAALSLRKDPVPPHPPSDFEMHRGEQVHEGAYFWNRGNVLVGFYGLYHNETNDRRFATMDVGLVVSNDVLHHREPIPDFKLVRWAEETETEGQTGVRLMPGAGVENIGERTIHWYCTWDWPPRGGIRVATWQRDRLGYFAPVPRQMVTGPGLLDIDLDPHFISCPITPRRPGGALYVNADGLSQHSFLTVEILDLHFRPVAGYSGDGCVPVLQSGLRQPVAWRGGAALPASGPIRIRVNWKGLRPEDARVYAVYVA